VTFDVSLIYTVAAILGSRASPSDRISGRYSSRGAVLDCFSRKTAKQGVSEARSKRTVGNQASPL
jgi:hypothetical protein